MSSANRTATTRQRYIDGVSSQSGFERRRFQIITTCIQPFLERLLGLVNLLAGTGSFVRRQLTQRLQARGKLTLLSEVGNPYRIKCGKVVCCVDFGRRLT